MSRKFRLREALTSLRIKDIDLEQAIVIVRAAKGDKERRWVLPEHLNDSPIQHIAPMRSFRKRGIIRDETH
jgi:hypothetical protein